MQGFGKRIKKNEIPGDKEGFIEAVVDIDNQIVVSYRLDLWSRELSVYQNALHFFQKYQISV